MFSPCIKVDFGEYTAFWQEGFNALVRSFVYAAIPQDPILNAFANLDPFNQA
jgi:hypothetical protein